MNPLEGMAGQMEWIAANMAYNLDFIPDDKMNWKPAPTATSAIEIVNHNVGAIKHLGAMLDGNAEGKPKFEPATDRDSAKKLLTETANAYAAKLRGIDPADLGKPVKTPFGEWPLARVASMPIVDTTHHHGQIAYLQMLLGDADSHFDISLF